jgi:hypothetical protein
VKRVYFQVYEYERNNGALEQLTLNYVDAIIEEMTQELHLLQPSEKLNEDETLLVQSKKQISHEPIQLTTQQNHQLVFEEEGNIRQEEQEIQKGLVQEVPSEKLEEPLPTQAINMPMQGMSLTFLSTLPRNIFTDGLNSFWHFVIGMFAVKYPLLVSLFIFYQILDRHDINICIDILEFILGFTITYFFLKI